MGGDRNPERINPQPGNQPEHDPYADARMAGAGFQRVAYTDTRGLPSCDQIFATIHQLDINGPNLVGRMDQFIGGKLRSEGVTFEQLRAMMHSPKFDDQDRMALSVMMNGFSKATNTSVENPHMTMQQFSAFLIRAGVQDQCQPPR